MARTQLEIRNESQADSAETVLAPSSPTEELATARSAMESESREVPTEEATVPLPGWRAALLRRLRSTAESRQTGFVPPVQREVNTTLSLLLEESRQHARWKRIYIGGAVGMLLLILLIAAVQGISFPMLNMLWAPLTLLLSAVTASLKQHAAAAAMTQFDDLRAVGPLAEALEVPNDLVVPLAEKALIRLLPRLKASDSLLLNSAQRACLNRALWGRNTPLALAVLKAWEQVGDADAISEVRKLAESRHRDEWASKAKNAARTSELAAQRSQGAQRSDGIRLFLLGAPIVVLSQADRAQRVAAAQECLPALLQSVERRQSGAQLLRPADANVPSDDILLRPATPHASTEPSDQLLRPNDNTI